MDARPVAVGVQEELVEDLFVVLKFKLALLHLAIDPPALLLFADYDMLQSCDLFLVVVGRYLAGEFFLQVLHIISVSPLLFAAGCFH